MGERRHHEAEFSIPSPSVKPRGRGTSKTRTRARRDDDKMDPSSLARHYACFNGIGPSSRRSPLFEILYPDWSGKRDPSRLDAPIGLGSQCLDSPDPQLET